MSNLLETIDKSDWQTFRFDEIAQSISKRVEPGATDLTVYVGLEHLDSGSLHIKRTGSPTDVDGTKLLVYAGDVIFGRRRAYQRKAAIATFDGICSAHALVLRAKPDVIDPELFPFFLHSDAFMHRAVDISVGGLSPTINWGNLKIEEFRIPPRDQHARLAKLLWAADETESKYKLVADTCKNIQESLLNEVAKSCDELIILENIATISYGMGVPPKLSDDGTPIIRATNVFRGKIVADSLIKTNPELVPLGKRVLLEEGDIIVVRSGAYTGDIGYIDEEWSGSLAGYDLVVKPDRAKIDPILLTRFLLAEKAQAYFKGESIRSAQPHLNAEQLRNTLVPNIKESEQRLIVKKLSAIASSLEDSLSLAESTRATKQALINQIFSA